MSTIRVYELAKEVNKTNKEVLDFLKSKNIDLTSHMSNVENAHADMVRANFKKEGNAGQDAGVQTDGEKPKKKLIQVFRPQNASHMPERKQKPQRQANAGAEQKSEEKRQRGTQDSMRQENRNNRSNNSRPNNGNTEGRSNNRQGGRFNNENRENRQGGRFNNENRENRQGGRINN